MNQISQKQNEEKYIRYLAAMRHLYNEDKVWNGILLITPIVFAVLGSSIASLAPFIAPLLAWLGVAFAIGEISVFPFFRSGKRSNAAKIQELFDCDILELPWNSALGDEPESTTIYQAYTGLLKQQGAQGIKSLENWYESHLLTDTLPITQARIVCQKENVWWDSELRREYARMVIVASVLFFFVVITASILANLTLQQMLQGPVALAVTVFLVGMKHGWDYYKTAEQLDSLNGHVKGLWKEAISGGTDDVILTQKSRDLQTEIFHYRTENLPVFSWYYEKLKKKYEDVLKKSNTLA